MLRAGVVDTCVQDVALSDLGRVYSEFIVIQGLVSIFSKPKIRIILVWDGASKRLHRMKLSDTHFFQILPVEPSQAGSKALRFSTFWEPYNNQMSLLLYFIQYNSNMSKRGVGIEVWGLG